MLFQRYCYINTFVLFFILRLIHYWYRNITKFWFLSTCHVRIITGKITSNLNYRTRLKGYNINFVGWGIFHTSVETTISWIRLETQDTFNSNHKQYSRMSNFEVLIECHFTNIRYLYLKSKITEILTVYSTTLN